MFVVLTRSFPPEIGGMQNLMGGLSKALLDHGPVKVFADKSENYEEYDKTSKIEIVKWDYHMPKLSEEEIKNFGKRSYHGFVARLYYKDIIQDIYAEPRILLEPKKLDLDSFIEGSLFPN